MAELGRCRVLRYIEKLAQWYQVCEAPVLA
jgi:hypothetical protein